ncbi:hypothetical protein Tdes44962_MAKER05606 [Teratosphaeria destructans]|uniref:Uncharacterized protein n=1 Tax=Teratosphaeria destructans TaxID=418781 RepID=A0A9W7SJI2_9PEZI|nr:hypothetical protein Tdes44962_MAKER05606 [Teratosphaeria destructans]
MAQSLALGLTEDRYLQAYLDPNFESSMVDSQGTAQHLESSSAAQILGNFRRKNHEQPTWGVEILDVKAKLRRTGVKRQVERAIVWVSLRARSYRFNEMVTTRDGVSKVEWKRDEVSGMWMCVKHEGITGVGAWYGGM